ncbi:MAG: TVP38/TMEM64 family protein [Armatimonadetes bacterium]|nr:TVP38/TMEM64 family protein [Armatimonadota bacterium]
MNREKLRQLAPRIGLVLLVIAALVAAKMMGLGHVLSFEGVKQGREQLWAYASQHYLGATLLFIALYAVLTTFSLPGAVALSVASGLVFGVVLGSLYTNVGATLGATGAFLLSRYVIGEWVQKRFGAGTLGKINHEIELNGASYLLVMRLVALFPFYFVNVAAGLTRVRLRTFIWTTSLGTLPGTAVFAYGGSRLQTINSIGDIFTPQVFLAFLLLGLLGAVPVAVQKVRRRRAATTVVFPTGE